MTRSKSKTIDSHTLTVLEYTQVLDLVARFASSDLGRQAARNLKPSCDPQWIRQRLAQTRETMDLLARGVRIPLAGIRDVNALLGSIGKRQTLLEPGQLIAIGDTLSAATRLRAFLLGLSPDQAGHLQTLACDLDDFSDLTDPIDQAVEDAQQLRDTASPRLYDLRRLLERLNETQRQRFAELVRRPSLRAALENGHFLLRHGRPVLAVKTNYRSLVRGTVLDRSHSGATLYIEPDELVTLSNDIEEARFEEKKEVDRILWDLTHRILRRQDDIARSIHALAWIDLTVAQARMAGHFGMTCPRVQADGRLQLRQARHPLLLDMALAEHDLEAAQDTVVPIDPRLGDDFDLLLVTGPNTGGKTVLLKTIGLCVLMAQSGLPIPAAPDSELPIYRQVFADIGDEQSLQQSLSTFSAHMTQIVRIIDRCQPPCLVLLDELGAGTDPTEGACLSCAILDALLERKSHVVATTHLGQLKQFAYGRARAENASVQFDPATLKPTYRLFIGTPGSSNALAIARRLHMPKTVLRQATALLEQQADGVSELLNQVQETRALAEEKRRRADRLLQQARALKNRTADRLEELRHQEQSLRQRAEHELERILRQVRERVQSTQRLLDQLPRAQRDTSEQLCLDLLTLAAESPLAVRHQAFVDGLKRGDRVFVLPLGRDAIVERIRRKRRRVDVLLDGKEIQLGFDQIARPVAP